MLWEFELETSDLQVNAFLSFGLMYKWMTIMCQCFKQLLHSLVDPNLHVVLRKNYVMIIFFWKILCVLNCQNVNPNHTFKCNFFLLTNNVDLQLSKPYSLIRESWSYSHLIDVNFWYCNCNLALCKYYRAQASCNII